MKSGGKMNPVTRTLLTVITCAGILVFGFNNCGFEVLKNPGLESGLDQVIEGQKLYASNCAACHGPIESSSKRDKTSAQINYAISSQPAMKFLSVLTPTEIGMIELALRTPVDPPGDSESKMVTEAEARVGNRYLIYSNLKEIFVSSALDGDDQSILTVLNDNVMTHPEAFGGGCTRYDLDCIPDSCRYSNRDSCTSDRDLKSAAAAAPAPNVMAKGYMVRTCEEILAIDKSVDTALRRAELRTESQPNPLPNATNVQLLMNFFFRNRPTNSDSVSQTVLLANAAAAQGLSVTDQWRFVMLSVCESDSADLL
jgi:hypothetical protein